MPFFKIELEVGSRVGPGQARSRWLAAAIGSMVLGAASAGAGPLEPPQPGVPANSAELAARIEPLIQAHQGKVAVAVKHLGTGESFRHAADEVMPTASLIKFPVMIEAYRQADAAQIDLDSRLILKDEDKVPGSGILTAHFSPGTSFPLRDAIRLMIVFSDNTATNLVLDVIGIGSTAATMERMGYPQTKIHSKVYRRDTSVFPDRSKRYGLGSTTANEMVRLFEELHHGRLVSAEACAQMTDHLKACDDDEKFPRFLPPGTTVAFKTGSVSDARTAAGIIDCPNGPVALCVLSCDNEDRRWVADNAGNLLCANIAKAVFDHFSDPTADRAGTGTESAAAQK